MTFLPLLFCVIVTATAELPNRRLIKPVVCKTDACFTVGDSIQQSIDKSLDPCTNFYDYGCGLWIKNNPVPSDSLELSKKILRESEIMYRMKVVLEEESEYDNFEPVKKLKQYYRSCMDEDAIENQGLEPIQLMLDANGGWPVQMGNHESSTGNYTWQEVDNNYLKMFCMSSFIEFGFIPDDEDETKSILTISYGDGSYLENEFIKRREHISSDQDEMRLVRVLTAFKKHKGIETSHEKLRADLKDLFSFQQKVKNISEIQKGITKMGHRMTITELQKYYDQTGTQHPTAQINWLHMIQELLRPNKDIDTSYPVLVINEHLFHKLAHVLDVTPSHVIVSYIQWNFVSQFLSFSTKQMRDIDLETTYMGLESDEEPRWKVCVPDVPLQHALSFLFVEKYISPNTTADVTEMLNDIKAEINERILNSTWTSASSKNFMIDKIDNILPMIGYPSWYDNETALIEYYKELEVGNNYFNNKISSEIYGNRKEFWTFLKPISRNQWDRVSPMTPNAIYDGSLNIMIIPAAVIQDPYFTPGMPLAVNYGAIGTIVGHELVHSFDITGMEYNKLGDKITSDVKTREAFEERIKCFVDQYNNFTLFEKGEDGKPVKLNGLLTRDENFADNIGLEVAFAAFQRRKLAVGLQPKLPELMDISDEQLFFISFANIWCKTAREGYEEMSANTDNHSPNRFRVLGTVANTPTFSDAFKCPVDNPLNQDAKCTVWK